MSETFRWTADGDLEIRAHVWDPDAAVEAEQTVRVTKDDLVAALQQFPEGVRFLLDDAVRVLRANVKLPPGLALQSLQEAPAALRNPETTQRLSVEELLGDSFLQLERQHQQSAPIRVYWLPVGNA